MLSAHWYWGPLVMLKLAYIALGGAAGAVLRYAASGCAYALLGTRLPWGTLFVNVTGSLMIGLLWALLENATVSQNVRAMLMIGLLGAFTTFSTFSLETMNLMRDKQFALAAVNVVASCVICIAVVYGGMVAGRVIGEALK